MISYIFLKPHILYLLGLILRIFDSIGLGGVCVFNKFSGDVDEGNTLQGSHYRVMKTNRLVSCIHINES